MAPPTVPSSEIEELIDGPDRDEHPPPIDDGVPTMLPMAGTGSDMEIPYDSGPDPPATMAEESLDDSDGVVIASNNHRQDVHPEHIPGATPPVPLNKLMVQPPADVSLGDGCLMHYTWSPILSDTNGKELWKFDKRSFRGGEGSTNFFTVLQEQPLPPAWDPNAGYKLQAGEVVTEEGLQLMRLMAETFNAGVRKLMKFPKGTGDAEDVRKVRGG